MAHGIGQPFDAESGDDGRSYGLKVARLDTPDEVRRKLDRNESSLNYGAFYDYRTQRYASPDWNTAGFDASYAPTSVVHRAAYAHVLDFWIRWLSPRWRVEAEVAGVYGSVGDARSDPAQAAIPKVLLRQWGGSLVVDYKATPNKLTLGAEVGAASGDDAAGFGNAPGYGPQPYGSLEGAQWGPNDRTIRNFRFNPAYRVDVVLFRQILGAVTDAMYVKPKLRCDILPGLGLDVALVYSRALEKGSTPSVNAGGTGGSANLGVELDSKLTYGSGDGFQAWIEWGALQPLGGLGTPQSSPGRAHVVATGLAAKF